MKISFILLALISVGSLFAQPLNGTTCKGKILYWEQVSHMRGAGIGPDGVLSHTQLVINKVVVERLEYKANAPFPRANYLVLFNAESKKIIENTGSSMRGSQTYTILVEVNKVDVTYEQSQLPIQEELLCKTTWAMLP